MHIVIYYFFSSFAGSYTAADGIDIVRQDIAHFISQRDGYPAASDDIVLTSGGAEGIEVNRKFIRQLKLLREFSVWSLTEKDVCTL